MKDLSAIGQDLFDKIRGRFPSVTLGNEEGKVTNDPKAARFFDFEYKDSGKTLGNVSVSISEDDGLTVIYSKDLVNNEDSKIKDNWFDFLRDLRSFSKKRLLNFDVRDITKSNLTKRDYKFLAQNRAGENTMSESTMYGTHKTSYQKIGNARLTIKHTQPINLESTHNRSTKIGSIYVESPTGERFRYPFRHLSGARAMARHVSEGGNQYDDFGKYISGLSEEIVKLQKFKSYMNRSNVMAEALSGYLDTVNERVQTVKKEIQRLQKESYYREAFDAFETPIYEEVPEDVAENWIDQLTIKQFNEELKDVFPYIYRLVGEATRARELGPDDLAEDDDPCWKNYKMVGTKKKGGKTVPNCVPEEIELEAGFEEMMGQFGERDSGSDNFTPDDIKRLERMPVDKAKEYAKSLVQNKGAKQMKMNKMAYFSRAIDKQRDTMGVIKLMYDLLLGGEGMRTIGSRYSTDKNWYSKTFDSEKRDLDGDNDIDSDDYMKAKDIAIKRAMGKDDEETKEAKTPLGEFILSYFDRTSGQFPKGETAVLTMVEKDYGEEFIEPAKAFIEQINNLVAERFGFKEPTVQEDDYELNDISRLAGL